MPMMLLLIVTDVVCRAVAAIGYHAYPTTPPYNFTKDPDSLKQVTFDAGRVICDFLYLFFVSFTACGRCLTMSTTCCCRKSHV